MRATAGEFLSRTGTERRRNCGSVQIEGSANVETVPDFNANLLRMDVAGGEGRCFSRPTPLDLMQSTGKAGRLEIGRKKHRGR